MKKALFIFIALFISSNLSAARVRTLRCNEKKKEGFVSLLDYVKKNWKSVEELWKQEEGIKKPACLKRRFTRNGIVICHKKRFVDPQFHRCIGKSGWANFGGLRAHICPGFFELTDEMQDHNKRACNTGLLFRLYGKNCFKRSRFPKSYMTLVEFGFNWYAQNNPVTIGFRDCNFL